MKTAIKITFVAIVLVTVLYNILTFGFQPS
jgi:hypothetical protein